MTNSVDLDERCSRCFFPRGAHVTLRLGWMRHPDRPTEQHIQFWQEGLCPDGHNMMEQPPWDMYVFHGAVSGSPYEDLGVKLKRPELYPEFDSTPYISQDCGYYGIEDDHEATLL